MSKYRSGYTEEWWVEAKDLVEALAVFEVSQLVSTDFSFMLSDDNLLCDPV